MINYLCKCGKMLFKGILSKGTKIEIKCKCCKAIREIEVQ